MIEKLIKDEQGFTTFGVVIALMISLSLIFTSAQVYRINSVSASIQDVADASALAAENEVAEFMILVHVCDAVVFSLSLASYVSTGLGVVCLCVPAAAEFSEGFISASKVFLQARRSFSESATRGLNAAQKALPFIAALKASAVAQSNNKKVSGANYMALTVVLPLMADEITVKDLDDEALVEELEEEQEEIKEEAQEAEDAAEEVFSAKEAGFQADCGSDSDYCMYERAESLAHLDAASNPLYSSADTWSFSVALDRARAYYRARLAQEAPASSSVEDAARSALRTRYYEYACELLEDAYVWDEGESFSAYFPKLPKNTDEMRATQLYTEAVYPVTEQGDHLVMHAYEGCPAAEEVISYGSVSDMESGDYEICDECQFSAARLGSVASATSLVPSGFEYHYNLVAQAAEDYEVARAEQEPLTESVKEKAEKYFDGCEHAAELLKNYRISATPPGKNGAIALVVDLSTPAASTGFDTSFVSSSNTLGVRAALSGATLLEDESEDGSTVITDLLTNISGQMSSGISAGDLALGVWSGLLTAYGNGQQALTNTIEQTLNGLPLIGKSGLGTWASKAFSTAMKELGLAPADIAVLKPVTVDTGSIGQVGTDQLSVGFVCVKASALKSATGLEGVAKWATGALNSSEGQWISQDTTIEIAVIQPLGSLGPSYSLCIPLPSSAQGFLNNALSYVAQVITASPLGEGRLRTWC